MAAPIGNGDTGIFTFAAQQITTENYFTIRFDHKFTDSDSIYATYIRDASQTVQPGTFGELSSDIVSSRQATSLHEQHIFSPNLLNVATIGFSRAVGIIGKVSSVSNPNMIGTTGQSFAFEPGGFAGDIQSIPGVTSFPGRADRRRDSFRPVKQSIGTLIRVATTLFSPMEGIPSSSAGTWSECRTTKSPRATSMACSVSIP